MGLVDFVKKVDDFASAPVEGSVFGGTLSLMAYFLVAVYLVVYAVTSSEATYPTSTSVGVFPNEVEESFLLPPMNCIATSGCYIKAMAGTNTLSGDNLVNQCVYLSNGEALPEKYRYIYYDSDPMNYFTVLSKDNDKSFALSYDVTKVTDYSATLEKNTLAAAIDDSLSVPMPYKIYKGVSVFNLVRTEGLDETVDTWTNTVTSETTTFDGTGGCCGGTVYLTDGTSDSTRTSSVDATACNTNKPGNGGADWWMTKFVPPTTYAVVSVSNPLDGFTLLGLLGGWLGIAFTFAGIIYWIHDEFLWLTGAEKADKVAEKEEVEMTLTVS